MSARASHRLAKALLVFCAAAPCSACFLGVLGGSRGPSTREVPWRPPRAVYLVHDECPEPFRVMIEEGEEARTLPIRHSTEFLTGKPDRAVEPGTADRCDFLGTSSYVSVWVREKESDEYRGIVLSMFGKDLRNVLVLSCPNGAPQVTVTHPPALGTDPCPFPHDPANEEWTHWSGRGAP